MSADVAARPLELVPWTSATANTELAPVSPRGLEAIADCPRMPDRLPPMADRWPPWRSLRQRPPRREQRTGSSRGRREPQSSNRSGYCAAGHSVPNVPMSHNPQSRTQRHRRTPIGGYWKRIVDAASCPSRVTPSGTRRCPYRHACDTMRFVSSPQNCTDQSFFPDRGASSDSDKGFPSYGVGRRRFGLAALA